MKGLDGLTVAITGSRRASELAHLIKNFGGVPYIAPTVGIASRELREAGAEELVRHVIDGRVDYVVFMTGPGTFTIMDMAEKLGLKQDFIKALNRLIIVARSPKPKSALEKHGVKVDIVPTDTHDNTAEGIAKEMKKLNLSGKRAAILWHGSRDGNLGRWFEEDGAKVFEYQVYEYGSTLAESGANILEKMGFRFAPPEIEKILKLIRGAIDGKIDVITFTSPPSARNLFQVANEHNLKEKLVDVMNGKLAVVAVGMPTRKAIEENGVRVDVMPDVYKMGPMVKALVDYVKVNPNPKSGKT